MEADKVSSIQFASRRRRAVVISVLTMALLVSLALSKIPAQQVPVAPAAPPVHRYAVVVSKATAADPAWAAVIDALKKKHRATVFQYSEGISETRESVGRYRPRYVCFVCPPTEDFPSFVASANRLCRTLDQDPYADAIWGILTGASAKHALEVLQSDPVAIRKAYTKTLGKWMNWVSEGQFVTEFQSRRGEQGKKLPGKDLVVTHDGPQSDEDDARRVAATLTEDAFDLIIGSGHGNHDRWMLMYPRGSAFLVSRDGKLTVHGKDIQLPVENAHPKVYWAVGNCLTGVINDGRNSHRHSYALAWMRNGARQYIGAVKSTWYELNWNMADWFLKQQGRWTFSESLFLLRQWSRHRLADGLVTGRDKQGVEFTDEIFVLYGDPAFEARVAPSRAPALEESLDVQAINGGRYRFTYTVKVNFVGEGRKRTAAPDGGWRVFTALLPFQVSDVADQETDFKKVVVADETLIWDAGVGLQVGDVRRLTFTATRRR
ncbi:MAG: hypothetical protein VX913_14595 [Planctomycetota bacterium]|nr:hypothetical protein [Planctomycetota bacterium]